MLGRVLILVAMVVPLFAQDSEVTKYIGELRAHAAARRDSNSRELLAELKSKVEAATDPKQKASLYGKIAGTEESLNEPEAAIEAARSAYLLEPGDGNASGFLAHLLAANGQMAEASALFGADAADGEALTRHAEQLLDSGERDLAIRCLQQAQRVLPGDAGVDDRLGVVYQRAGRVDDGLRTLLQAETKAPASALIHLHLAFSFAQKNNRDYAREELNSALACHPSDEVRAAIDDLRALIGRP